MMEQVIENEQDLEKLFDIASVVQNIYEIRSKLQKKLYDRIYDLYIEKGKLYNSDGLLIEKFDDDILWSFSPDDEEVVDEFDRKKLPSIVDEDNISILLEQLKTKAREFNEKNVDLTETSQNNEGNYMDVSVIGNLIKLENGNYYEFYSVNSDGTLNAIEPRRKKKIYR